MRIAEGYIPFKKSDREKMAQMPRVAKGYRPLKLVSPVQQQTEMAKALVKEKTVKSKGIRKPVRKNKKRRPVQKRRNSKKIYPIKIVHPVQQYTDMAKMLVQRKNRLEKTKNKRTISKETLAKLKLKRPSAFY